jgi:hypothetical protein
MKLFLINLGLILANFISISAQAAPLICDTTSFPDYLISQLPGLGVDAAQAEPLLACTEFIECLPITTAIINAQLVSPIDEPFSAESWATVCPECMLLNALIVTMIIYFKQSQNNIANQFFPYPFSYGGGVQPYYIAFPLANLATFLSNVAGSPATAPTLEQCASLFASGKYSDNPFINLQQDLWPYTAGMLCEATTYLGNLYENLNITAQAKLIALTVCYLPKIIPLYQNQANGLTTCINDILPSILSRIALPAPFPSTLPTDFPIAITIHLQNQINTLKELFITYNTIFNRLTNCCKTADELCQTTYGTDYSSSILTATDSNAIKAQATLKNMINYEDYKYTSGPYPNTNTTTFKPGMAPTNMPCLVTEWPCSSVLQQFTCDQCCYGNVGDGHDAPGPIIFPPSGPTSACLYNNSVLWSQLALLLSGGSTTPFSIATFNSTGGTIFKSGTDIINAAYGASGDHSSPCDLGSNYKFKS